MGKSRLECAAMYLIEKSLTANKYPRQAIAVVMQTVVASAAFRPLAINLSCLSRMPRIDAITEYADTTQASARANWPSCAAMLVTLFRDLNAGGGFLFVFGSAFGEHSVCDENTVASHLARRHCRGAVD